MKGSRKAGPNLLLSFMCLALVLFLSASASADPLKDKGRGHAKGKKVARSYDDRGRRYRGGDDWRHSRQRSKKEEKFINGHDARDGRWDGRGPQPRIRRLPPRRRY